MAMQKEFDNYESNDMWETVLEHLDQESHDVTRNQSQSAANFNMVENRYCNVLPFDDHRVKLEDEKCDYINASLVEVLPAHRKYILAQGPLEHTGGKFWLMAWQRQCRGVVMLTRLIEHRMPICDRYYPDSSAKARGRRDAVMRFADVGLVVTLKSSDWSCGSYVLRTFLLTNTRVGESRAILHYQFLNWPDYGVPEGTTQFISFLQQVRATGILSQQNGCGPAIVHCSAGIGRSGTFCLVDSVLEMMQLKNTHENIDVLKVLLGMRKFRYGLIQTPEQLRFAYLSILHGCKVEMLVTPSNPSNPPDSESGDPEAAFLPADKKGKMMGSPLATATNTASSANQQKANNVSGALDTECHTTECHTDVECHNSIEYHTDTKCHISTKRHNNTEYHNSIEAQMSTSGKPVHSCLTSVVGVYDHRLSINLYTKSMYMTLSGRQVLLYSI